jgi:hypothetical protein
MLYLVEEGVMAYREAGAFDGDGRESKPNRPLGRVLGRVLGRAVQWLDPGLDFREASTVTVPLSCSPKPALDGGRDQHRDACTPCPGGRTREQRFLPWRR